jgi:hypothetical protein
MNKVGKQDLELTLKETDTFSMMIILCFQVQQSTIMPL